jgi:hypothetical protein
MSTVISDMEVLTREVELATDKRGATALQMPDFFRLIAALLGYWEKSIIWST